MKTGIIDVGGGMRDIYGAGVLDYCMEQEIWFDYCVGVSAGSANLVAYLSSQPGRNYRSYTEYSFRKAYMSWQNWVKTRNYLDLDYIYGTLCEAKGEDPLDFPSLMANPAVFKIVATNARSGKAKYFDKSDLKQDQYDPIKASCCVPVANKPYLVEGIPYFDGGFADPIPLDYCLQAGCDRVVIILTRPKTYQRDPENDKLPYRMLRRRYPESAKVMANRAHLYNAQLKQALELERKGSVLILAPDDILGMKTLTRDRGKMNALYRKGLQDAAFLKEWL